MYMYVHTEIYMYMHTVVKVTLSTAACTCVFSIVQIWTKKKTIVAIRESIVKLKSIY